MSYGGHNHSVEPEDEGMKGWKERAKKQFASWRDIWVRGTGSEDKEPIFAYGHMFKYLIEPDHTPFLDLLGGGGFVPLGPGNSLVGEAMGKMAGQAYQTSDRGDHAYSATAEFMNKVEGHLPKKLRSPAWQFASSETEAFLLLMEALSVDHDEIVVVNGPSAWPYVSNHRHWSTVASLYPDGPAWRSIGRAHKVALVVYPVNPDSFEVVDETTLTLIDSLQGQTDVTLIWDLTVTAGWTREVFDVHPEADAVILGGAYGGGLPFGAVLSAERLPFPRSGRWSATAGNALAAQLGLHVLLQCEEARAQDKFDELVAAVGREVETIQTQLPGTVRSVTGGGLLGGLGLNSVEEARRVVEGLRNRGVLVGSLGIPRGVVTFRVSRATDPHDVAELFDKIFEILTEEEQRE